MQFRFNYKSAGNSHSIGYLDELGYLDYMLRLIAIDGYSGLCVRSEGTAKERSRLFFSIHQLLQPSNDSSRESASPCPAQQFCCSRLLARPHLASDHRIESGRFPIDDVLHDGLGLGRLGRYR